MNLGKYIQQLLLDNEMVIIPGFGAFISEYKPAELQHNSDELKPPSTQIIFNAQIRNNDGLLVGFVAENGRSSHFEALQRIEKERDNIIYKLDKGEKVELEGLGTLSHNDEHEIIFSPIEEKAISLESFGLETVLLKEEEPKTEAEAQSQTTIEHPNAQEEEPIGEPANEFQEEEVQIQETEEVTSAKAPPHIIEDLEENKKRKRGWLWLLVLVPLIGVSVFAFLRGMKDGNAAKEQNRSNETTLPQQKPTVLEEDSVSNDTLITTEEDTTIQIEETETDSVTTEEITSKEKYYLISGSFSVEDNAIAYMKELQGKGIEAFNAGKKGRFFCVGIGIYNTFEEAEKAKVEFMKNNPGSEGWVWKK